jgi:hypothetical protein
MGGVVEQQRQRRKVQRAEVCDEVVPETRTINQKREVEVEVDGRSEIFCRVMRCRFWWDEQLVEMR